MNALPTISAHTASELQPGVLSIWRGFIPASRYGHGTVPDAIRDRVVAEVSAETGVAPREIMSRARTARIYSARLEAIGRLRDMKRDDGAPRFSLPAIGRAFDRDHGTIHYAVEKRQRGRVSA